MEWYASCHEIGYVVRAIGIGDSNKIWKEGSFGETVIEPAGELKRCSVNGQTSGKRCIPVRNDLRWIIDSVVRFFLDLRPVMTGRECDCGAKTG